MSLASMNDRDLAEYLRTLVDCAERIADATCDEAAGDALGKALAPWREMLEDEAAAAGGEIMKRNRPMSADAVRALAGAL